MEAHRLCHDLPDANRVARVCLPKTICDAQNAAVSGGSLGTPVPGTQNAASQNANSTQDEPEQLTPRSMSQSCTGSFATTTTTIARELEFDEVFQGGKAEVKNMIVQHPKRSENWYILRCEEHEQKFGPRVLLAASKHIHSRSHDYQPKTFNRAIELLGWRVLNCTAEKAEENNNVFQAEWAAAHGAAAHGAAKRDSRSSRAAAEGFHDDSSPFCGNVGRPWSALEFHGDGIYDQLRTSSGLKAAAFKGLADPVAGHVYQAFWPKDERWYAVVVLSISDLSEFGLSEAFRILRS